MSSLLFFFCSMMVRYIYHVEQNFCGTWFFGGFRGFSKDPWHVILGILSTYFSSPYLISLRASSAGTKVVRREMEEKLATYVQFPCRSPSTVLSTFPDNQHEAETSANVNKHWKTRSKNNDVITNVISANQHFASTFSMQIFKFQRRNCKLSFLLLERPGELARRLLLKDP